MSLSISRVQWAACVFMLAALLAQARAQSGVSILPANIYEQSGRVGANATAEPIGVSGQAFTQGYRITVAGTSRSAQDAALAWPTAARINQGDNLQLTFWVRKVAPLDGHNIRGLVGLEKAVANGAREFYAPFPCDSNGWTKYILPFKSAGGYAAGEARLVFHFAHGPQTFEIGGLVAVNLGPTPPLESSARPVLADDVYASSYHYVDSRVGGSVTPITIADQSFNRGYRIVHFGDSDFVYRSGLGWKNVHPIAKDDLLLLTFWARKLEPAGTPVIRAQVIFERAGGNFEKSLTTSFPNDTAEWKLFQLPFRSSAAFGPDEAQLAFQFAYGPQSFEIGGISLINYGQNVRPEQLRTSYYYPSRGDANAAWRIAAENRINRLRKGTLSVQVVDRDGAPVPQATVHIQQANHAFRFGSAVTAARLMGAGADNDIYRSRVTSHFTTTVFENDLKWGLWECANCGSSFNKGQTRAAIAWLAERGLPVRGHNLIWPSWNFMPADVRNLGPDALRARIAARFADVAGDAGVLGRLYHWDVINEPYTSFDVMGRIGGIEGIPQGDGVLPNAEMAEWFRLAPDRSAGRALRQRLRHHRRRRTGRPPPELSLHARRMAARPGRAARRRRRPGPFQSRHAPGADAVDHRALLAAPGDARRDRIRFQHPRRRAAGRIYARCAADDLQSAEVHRLSDVGLLGALALAARGRDVSRRLVLEADGAGLERPALPPVVDQRDRHDRSRRTFRRARLQGRLYRHGRLRPRLADRPGRHRQPERTPHHARHDAPPHADPARRRQTN